MVVTKYHLLYVLTVNRFRDNGKQELHCVQILSDGENEGEQQKITL